MSKVLVDRELLEKAERNLASGEEAYRAQQELRAVIAQPAEAEGVDVRKIVVDALVGMISGVTSMTPPTDLPLPGFIQAPVDRAVERITAALSAVTAERDRLREANASRSDKLNEAQSIIDQLRAEVETLRGLAAECAGYLSTHSTTTISSGSILHRKLIDAAMAAKEG